MPLVVELTDDKEGGDHGEIFVGDTDADDALECNDNDNKDDDDQDDKGTAKGVEGAVNDAPSEEELRE